MNKKKIIVAVIVIWGLLLISKNLNLFPSISNKSNADEPQQGIVTELYEVKKVPMQQDLSYLGSIESEVSSILSSKTIGNILSVNVSEGDIVHEGDILLEIDTGQLEAKLSTTEQKRALLADQLEYFEVQIADFYVSNPIVSKIGSAKLTYEYKNTEIGNLRILYEAGAISKSTLDQAEYQLENFNIQLKELEATADASYDKLVQERDMTIGQLEEVDSTLEEISLAIEEAAIKAPFDGQVAQMMVSVGELASIGRTLLTIDDIHRLQVVTPVGETDLGRIKTGMDAEIIFVGSDEIIKGVVSYKSPSINPKTRIGEIRIALDIPEGKTVVGSSAKIRVLLDSTRNEIMIPAASVKTLGNDKIVYVYNGKGMVYERKLTIGENIDGKYHVIEGLAEGDIIAVRNIQDLSDGVYIYTLEQEVIQ